MKRFVLAAAALAASISAHAQFADQSYYFAGTVMSSNDPFITDGSRITGTYNFNLGNVTLDPAWNGLGNVDGPINAGSPWDFALPAGFGGSMFNATAKVDGQTLSTPGGSAASLCGGLFL